MLSERQRNELIGRAAMLVLAVLLIAGGIALIRSGIATHGEENKFYAERRSLSTRRREARIGPFMIVGGVLLGGAGVWLLKPALLSHRNLDRKPPKPPVLWENPWDQY